MTLNIRQDRPCPLRCMVLFPDFPDQDYVPGETENER